MKILDRDFCISPITFGKVDPNIDWTITRSQIEASRIIFFQNEGFGENLKNPRGSNQPSLVSPGLKKNENVNSIVFDCSTIRVRGILNCFFCEIKISLI